MDNYISFDITSFDCTMHAKLSLNTVVGLPLIEMSSHDSRICFEREM